LIDRAKMRKTREISPEDLGIRPLSIGCVFMLLRQKSIISG
jgi:hypothetical protein